MKIYTRDRLTHSLRRFLGTFVNNLIVFHHFEDINTRLFLGCLLLGKRLLTFLHSLYSLYCLHCFLLIDVLECLVAHIIELIEILGFRATEDVFLVVDDQLEVFVLVSCLREVLGILLAARRFEGCGHVLDFGPVEGSEKRVTFDCLDALGTEAFRRLCG